MHDIKKETLVDYTGDSEIVGSLIIGESFRNTHIRYKNLDDYEAYFNSIDVAYISEGADLMPTFIN